MRCMGRLIGLVLAFAFIVVFPCSLWTFNAQRIMLNGDTYKKAFQDKDFYQNILPGVLPALLEDLQDRSAPPADAVTLLNVINHLDRRDWDRIAPQFVPLDWVQSTVETNLDAFLAWVEGDANNLNLVFHTDALSRRLSGPPGEAAVPVIADALPACSGADQSAFDDYVNTVEGSAFPYCRPADPAQRTSLIAIIDQARLDAAAEFPADIDVIADMRTAHAETGRGSETPFSDAQLDRFRAGVRLWKKLVPLTLMIPLALLSMIVIFAVRSSKLFFRWVGWSLIAGCLLSLAPLFLLPFVVSDLNIQASLQSGFAAGGALIAEVVGNRMVELMVGQFTWPILVQSAGLLLAGFVFAVVSVLLHDPDAPPEPVASSYAAVPVYETPPDQPLPADQSRGSSQKNV